MGNALLPRELTEHGSGTKLVKSAEEHVWVKHVTTRDQHVTTRDQHVVISSIQVYRTYVLVCTGCQYYMCLKAASRR